MKCQLCGETEITLEEMTFHQCLKLKSISTPETTMKTPLDLSAEWSKHMEEIDPDFKIEDGTWRHDFEKFIEQIQLDAINEGRRQAFGECESAMSPKKLRLLSMWCDIKDAQDGNSGKEIQVDLQNLANVIEKALSAQVVEVKKPE